MPHPQVGWIGLGSMGIAMSKNLQTHLAAVGAPSLLFTNRTMSRGQALKEWGGIPIETVDELARKSEIIFSCVSRHRLALSLVADLCRSVMIRSLGT